MKLDEQIIYGYIKQLFIHYLFIYFHMKLKKKQYAM